MTGSPQTLVKLEGVSKVYHKDQLQIRALRGIDLEVAVGEFLAVVGPSGSGKSTLLNVIGGIDLPTEGRYLFKGSDIASFGDYQLSRFRNRRVGIVFQSFNLLPSLTAWENVALPLYYAGLDLPERRRKACAALDLVGLANRITHYPSQLSGGEEQRVAFARAIVSEPDLIVADEPTGNLDSAASDQVAALLAALQAERRTIIMATHNPGMAERAQRRITLVDGQVAGEN